MSTSRFDWGSLRDMAALPSVALPRQLGDLAALALERTLRVAVTGLRHSGKTVFITALVHHLLSGRELPFLSAAQEGRLLGARLLPPRSGDLPPFPFAAARAALAATAPRWPEPTTGLSSLRLAVRVQTKGLLRRQLAEHHTLTVEIIDYPGEWLLDLPLLEQSFKAWSDAMLALAEQAPRAALARDWRSFLTTLDPAAPLDRHAADMAVRLYADYLRRCDDQEQLSFLQPGRLIMPGDGPDARRPQFCPLPLAGEPPEGSLGAAMAGRYERYRRRVIRPFYRDHFSRFDRQVVLVDLLSLLNRGQACFEDAQRALGAVLLSFRYGASGLLARLFRPRIDTLLFAASKADHVAHNQHHNLRLLLERMVADAAGQARFEGVTPAFVALSAHNATDVVRTEHHGQMLSCVRGQLKGEARQTVLFPGEIPPELPSAEDWEEGRFRFRDFAPRRLRLEGDGRPQHIRLDQVLEVLLGDRLQ